MRIGVGRNRICWMADGSGRNTFGIPRCKSETVLSNVPRRVKRTLLSRAYLRLLMRTNPASIPTKEGAKKPFFTRGLVVLFFRAPGEKGEKQNTNRNGGKSGCGAMRGLCGVSEDEHDRVASALAGKRYGERDREESVYRMMKACRMKGWVWLSRLPEEHLGDKSVLVHWFLVLALWYLGPHLCKLRGHVVETGPMRQRSKGTK